MPRDSRDSAFLNIPYPQYTNLYFAFIAGSCAFGLEPRATLQLATGRKAPGSHLRTHDQLTLLGKIATPLSIVVIHLQYGVYCVAIPFVLLYHVVMPQHQPLIGKSPLKVVGWLSWAGRQTIIHQATRDQSQASSKTVAVSEKAPATPVATSTKY